MGDAGTLNTDGNRAGMLEFPCDVTRLENGNTLIADAGDVDGVGSEILEVSPQGEIVWRYAEGLRFAHSAKRLANGNTLVADTTNDRVIEITPAGEVAFTTDSWGAGSGRLSDGSHLLYPNDAHELPDGTLLVTDRNNDRCVIADRSGNVVWEYREGIRHPHNCDATKDGTVLIADSDGKRILEVNRDKETVWSYGDGNPETLNWPRDADRLPNGNTLVTDSRNSRLLEIDRRGKVKWTYQAAHFANFYDADKLENGNVLFSDQQRHQVLEVDAFGNVVWAFRNFRITRPVLPRLKNGSFKERTEDGMPAMWTLFTRLSEGGGKVIWDEEAEPRPCPGLEYDRPGALYLGQTIGVKPGRRYKMGGMMRSEGLAEGVSAYFQIAWMDAYGAYTADTASLPKGRLFTGTTGWEQDAFECTAPEQATAAEVRVFLSGKGRIWAKGIMVFA